MCSMPEGGTREGGKGVWEEKNQAGRRVERTPKGRESDGVASIIVNQGVGLDLDMAA